MKKLLYSCMIVILLLSSSEDILIAKDSGKNNKKVLGTAGFTRFNINNISTRICNNGFCDDNANPNLEGLVFPKGSGKTAVFVSGFLWGGKVDGQIRVGGSAYLSGLQPGKILSSGSAQDTNSSTARIFRVRRDYAAGDLSSEIRDGEGTEEQIRAQYKKDWNEWPSSEGAPYNDVDGDGKYNPDIDIPGVPGADQTIFYIANDLDSSLTNKLYGSPPVGIEIHVTVWGYTYPSPFDNMYFKKYQIINKSNNNFSDVYFGQWSDVDDGFALDDLDGCDTLLNLGYTFNSASYDSSMYRELSPPAVGFHFIQGPFADGNSSDTAIFMGRHLPGKKNQPMTGVGYVFKNNSFPNAEPAQGDYLKGSVYIYNFMQGKLNNGEYFPVPAALGGGVTPFPYSGDPVTGQGFLDTLALDKRIMVSSGPVNMAPSDTQEVIIAEILAGAIKNSNNLASISLLKSYVLSADSLYKNNFARRTDPSQEAALGFTLNQNYPNPFNPSTTITYEITKSGLVQLKIYDILGREIATLVNDMQAAGKHSKVFDLQKTKKQLSSGIYFYRLKLGSNISTKKMILLK